MCLEGMLDVLSSKFKDQSIQSVPFITITTQNVSKMTSKRLKMTQNDSKKVGRRFTTAASCPMTRCASISPSDSISFLPSSVRSHTGRGGSSFVPGARPTGAP